MLLGLLVSWSIQGLALGIAALIAFLARTPAKIALVDLRRNRWFKRSTVAVRVASIEISVIIALLFFAGFKSDPRFWLPFVVAAPLVAIQLWFDIRSKSRRLLPELAGTIGISSIVAVILLANGESFKVALGLWIVVATRGSAAIPYVRTQVLRIHGRSNKVWHSDLAQGLAIVSVVIGWLAELVPLASAIAISIIAIFNFGAVRLSPRPAKVIGLQQMFFGIAVVLVTTIAVM